MNQVAQLITGKLRTKSALGGGNQCVNLGNNHPMVLIHESVAGNQIVAPLIEGHDETPRF